MKSYHVYLIAALSGCAAGCAFPPIHAGFLAYLAFIPLLWILETRPKVHRNLLLYVFFFCFHGAANWWVMSWQKETDPYLMAAGAGLWLGHPFFLMPAFWIYSFVRRRTSLKTALITLPFAWTTFEWIHSLTDASYPWLTLGYTQTYYTTMIQVADIGGVWVLSFVIMSVNSIIAHFVLRSTRAIHGTRRSMIIHASLIAAVFCVVLSYGVLDVFGLSFQKAMRVSVGIVQPSINPWSKWKGGLRSMIGLHQHLQDSVNALGHCDLSLWSETSIPVGLKLPEHEDALWQLRSWVDSNKTSLLCGYADYQIFNSTDAPANAQSNSRVSAQKFRVYNAAGLLNPGSLDIPSHHKSKLTPFGEYMPFSDDFPQIQSWLKWGVGISGWNKGAGATVLPLVRGSDTIAHIGPVICIESIYPNYVADYVRRGADMLAVITNDAWYDGTAGPEQHYCISRMRAVECRREIIRCGNSGICGFISAKGESINQAEPRQVLALAGNIHRHSGQSFYVKYGDWLPMLSLIVTLAMMLRRSKLQ